uniref:Uncharacterized protein n=1 Tax=Oryzias sinensis TaxID=183150 RepID=A0A8C7X0D5_9TELE
MKLAVVLACFVVFCLAEKPLPCTSPPLLTGGFIVTTQNEKVGIFGKYLYDAVGQRVRLFDIGSFKNKTFTADVLLHYSDVSHSQSPFFCLQEISTASCDSKKLPQQFISIALQLTSTLAGLELPVQLCSRRARDEHSSMVFHPLLSLGA